MDNEVLWGAWATVIGAKEGISKNTRAVLRAVKYKYSDIKEVQDHLVPKASQ